MKDLQSFNALYIFSSVNFWFTSSAYKFKHEQYEYLQGRTGHGKRANCFSGPHVSYVGQIKIGMGLSQGNPEI